MKKTTFVVIVTIILLSLPATGFSLDFGSMKFGGFAGLFSPREDISMGDMGLTIGGQALVPFDVKKKFWLGSSMDFSMASGDGDYWGVEVLGFGRYYIPLNDKFRAFGQLGVGLLFWDHNIDMDGLDLGYVAGGGVEFLDHFEVASLLRSFGPSEGLTLTFGYNF